MGLFDFLFGRAEDPNFQLKTGIIWITAEGKFDGIAKRLAEPFLPMSPGAKVSAAILVAPFQDSLARLEEIAAKTKSTVPVQALLADEIFGLMESRGSQFETDSIEFLIAERFPLDTQDDELVETIRSLPFPTRVEFHVSLDDEIMKRFSGDHHFRQTLEMGGFNDDTPIESRMVYNRLRKSQRIRRDSVINDLPANSAAEWMAKNLPDNARW